MAIKRIRRAKTNSLTHGLTRRRPRNSPRQKKIKYGLDWAKEYTHGIHRMVREHLEELTVEQKIYLLSFLKRKPEINLEAAIMPTLKAILDNILDAMAVDCSTFNQMGGNAA